MWLTDMQSASTSNANDTSTDRKIEIGVALTTFGGLFMLLGVMLFFDGALLALGNVRLYPVAPIQYPCSPDSRRSSSLVVYS